MAATMDNPAPDRVASVKSLGIFLKAQRKKYEFSSPESQNSQMLSDFHNLNFVTKPKQKRLTIILNPRKKHTLIGQFH